MTRDETETAAIDVDIAGEQAHAKVLDADTKSPLRDIHRRVGTAILFEPGLRLAVRSRKKPYKSESHGSDTSHKIYLAKY